MSRNSSSNFGGGEPAKATRPAPPIVPGQQVFSPAQMRQLLGGISESSYYELRAKGLLKFSRADKGKQALHTMDQYLEYVAYLNSEGQVQIGSEISDWKFKKAASR
jgi:hypothetical protein